MVSGRIVYRKIKNKIEELEKQNEGYSKKIYAHEEKISSLTEEREEIYLRLAQTYLPQLDAESVESTLKEVQGEVKRIFQEKRNRRKNLETLIGSCMEERSLLKEKLETITEQLEDKVKEREGTKKRVYNELKDNKEYSEFKDYAVIVDKKLSKNKKVYKEFKTDVEKKLKTYKENNLFAYLLNKGFDTENYEGNFITKRLDSLIAGLVNYTKAKQNYDFLTLTPVDMKEEVDGIEKELKDTIKKMQRIESKVAEDHELPKILEQGTKLGKTRESILADITQKDAEQDEYNNERKRLDSIRGEYHKEALNKLKTFLKGRDISELKARVHRTESEEDDNLVNKLEKIDQDIKEEKENIKRFKTEQSDLSKKLTNLNKTETSYRKRDWDSGRSYFNGNLDIDALLVGYLMGKFSSDDLDKEIKDNHHFSHDDASYSSSSYSSGSRDNDSYHSSDSSSDSSFSSGGGFGGGGFSTGGGF